VAKSNPAPQEYTQEEMLVLASLRRGSKRTCGYCAWHVHKGGQRGCFPDGNYRKWLSQAEYESGCDRFAPREETRTVGSGHPGKG